MNVLPEWFWILFGFLIGWNLNGLCLQLAYRFGIVKYIGRGKK